VAVEIGTDEGVSAAYIARAIAAEGMLHCVDPWIEIRGTTNPSWCIAMRHLRRTRVMAKINIHRDFSQNVLDAIPAKLEFAFIDGDHSRKGIEIDWSWVAPRIEQGGIVCLHDSVTPASEPWRVLDSTRYFTEVIAQDPRFEVVETVHSLAVLRRR